MKVFFTGPQGTGKSQTLNLVSEITGWPSRASLSRNLWQVYFRNNGLDASTDWKTLDNYHQETYQQFASASALKILLSIEDTPTPVLFDRSLVDFYAYTVFKHANNQVSLGCLSTIETLLEASAYIPGKSIGVYFSPDSDVAIEDNGIRDLSSQQDLDDIFKNNRLNALTPGRIFNNVIISTKGSIQEKAYEIIKFVNGITEINNRESL